jgi:hypothetical protein
VGQFDPPGLTKKSAAYHEWRIQETEPPYSLARIKKLVDSAPAEKGDEDWTAITDVKFKSLSTAQKFTYCMLHAENFSQNCDGMPAFVNEEKRIFGYPAKPFFDQASWSDRQEKFLHSHRSEVIRLLKGTIHTRRRVGSNLKMAILELKAKELIPDMAAQFATDRKDLDLLSTCCALMKEARYRPFMKTAVARALYKDEDASHQARIPATGANERLILAQADAFYHSRK